MISALGAHARVTPFVGGEAPVPESLLEPPLPTPTSHGIRLFHSGPGDSQKLPSEGLVHARGRTPEPSLLCGVAPYSKPGEVGSPGLDGSAVLPVPQLRASSPRVPHSPLSVTNQASLWSGFQFPYKNVP